MSTKNILIAAASAIGLIALVLWLRNRKPAAVSPDPSLADPDLTSTSNSCINVASGLTPWNDSAFYDHDGIDGYMKGRVVNRYQEFNLPSKDSAVQYALGFFKAIDVKPTKPNVKQYENEMIAYLKSDDKFPHWDESIGRRRC